MYMHLVCAWVCVCAYGHAFLSVCVCVCACLLHSEVAVHVTGEGLLVEAEVVIDHVEGEAGAPVGNRKV